MYVGFLSFCSRGYEGACVQEVTNDSEKEIKERFVLYTCSECITGSLAPLGVFLYHICDNDCDLCGIKVYGACNTGSLEAKHR